MKKEFEILGTNLIIHIPAELDHHNAEWIRREADQLLHTRTIRQVIFDFEKTSFMDSSGIGMIMGRYKAVRLMGGSAAAIRVNDRIRRILTLSGVYKHIGIFEGDEQSAADLEREE